MRPADLSRLVLPLVTSSLMAIVPTLAHASTVTFTDRAAFEASLPAGFYLNNFGSVPTALDSPAPSVSGTGGTPVVTYTITAPTSGVVVAPDEGFKAIGNWTSAQNVVVTFDSGNVFSAGGEVWLSNISGGRLVGNITVDFSNGSQIVVPSTTSGAFGFAGISTTDGPLTSMTLNAVPGQFLNLTNLSVSAAVPVPEPSALALLGCAAVCGGWMWRRRSRQRVG